MSATRARGRSAMAAAVLTLLVCVTSTVVVVLLDARLSRLGRPDLHQLTGSGAVFLVAEASSALVGAVLLLRRPGHPVGWCFAALGASVALTAASQSYGLVGLLADPGTDYPASGSAAVLASSLFVLWLLLIGTVCYLTPTGVHLSSRWRRCARVMWFSGAVWLATILLMPAALQAPFGEVQNPWGVPALQDVLAPVRVVAGAVNNVLVLAAFACLLVRFRRSVGEERRQLLWMGIAVIPVPVLLLAAFVAARTGNAVLVDLAAAGFVAVLPLSAGLAVAKTRLYDVDRILSAATSYLLLSGILAATYAAVVLVVGPGLAGFAGSSTVSVALAALAVAVLARPAHRAVQDAVDKRFSRRRYDALRVVREHVASPDPDRTIEQVLRQALGAPDLTVAYWVQDRGAWVTGEGASAPAPGPGRTTTVRRSGRDVARICTGDADATLTRSVLREAEPELDNAALRAAVSLQLEEVRSSRERLAGAQLEERRRVEQDLHDGAQQRLLALAARLQAALLNGEASRMREALQMGVEQSRAAVQELRELANGLHPSALADGGLAAALDELAARHRVQVHVADRTRRYPAGVEATAWFIACEGVSNAVKHAAARCISVHVAPAGDELRVIVEDDGRGGADPTGSGLRGLADRAEAVGGQLSVLPRQPTGTSVSAVLPCTS